MVYKNKIFLLLISLSIGLSHHSLQAIPKNSKKLISFNFENEELTNIINYLAAEKKINIILPPPPNTLNTKVTLHHQKKLSVNEAFRMLNTLLDMSGYTMVPHGNTYIISKSNNTVRSALPVYIGVAPEDLPDSDAPIRYLYYFDNIKIPKGGTGQAQDIKTILEDILQDPTKPGTTQIIFDSSTNSMILTAKAFGIKMAMKIIEELDKTGFRETVEVIQLTNTSAGFVQKFLTEQLLASIQTAPAIGPQAAAQTDTHYFSQATKVIADPRSNSLIILGRSETVDKLKYFIYDYIDIPLESGDSLIHIYELQYLDAQSFAADLQTMIKPTAVAGQAKGASIAEQSFQGVIIEAEKPSQAKEQLQTQAGAAGVIVQGGNRLIVAAKKNDWEAIKQLIESLDKPQPQIALEVLIADISLQDSKALGSQLRNKGNSLPTNVNTQFAGLGNPVTFNETLQQDLLRPVFSSSSPSDGTEGFNLANNPPTQANSFVLSFNDPNTNGIWLVMNMLKNFQSTKILSHPHLVTLNQIQAKMSISEKRLAPGPVVRTPDGNTARQQVDLEASLSIEILPRINLSNTINLQIAVKVNNFVSPDSDTRNTRTVITNATIANGEVLVLGGLVRTSNSEQNFRIPILGQIPLIGWFFRSKSKSVSKDNLMMFISPTIIRPKVGGGMSSSSSYKLAHGKKLVDEEAVLFAKVKDPITHWFFRPAKNSTRDLVDKFKERRMFDDKPLVGGESEEDLKAKKLAAANSPLPSAKRTRNRVRMAKNNSVQEKRTPEVAKLDNDNEQKLKSLLALEKNPLRETT
jgi:general secretion pathway protein D